MDCLSESSGRSILSNEKYFSGSGSDDNNDDENDRNSVYESPSSDNDVVFDPSKGISEPDPNDVICGRGKMTSLHPANRRFRELVNENKDAYQRAKRRDEKTRITYELVDKLRIEGRFVLFDPKTQLWYEVSDDYAREKVSHSLRSRPISEQQRRTKPKIRKKTLRKQTSLPALDGVVHRLIQDQQHILNMMIQKETNRVTADVVIGRSGK